jgi:hypothetical protein
MLSHKLYENRLSFYINILMQFRWEKQCFHDCVKIKSHSAESVASFTSNFTSEIKFFASVVYKLHALPATCAKYDRISEYYMVQWVCLHGFAQSKICEKRIANYFALKFHRNGDFLYKKSHRLFCLKNTSYNLWEYRIFEILFSYY